MYLIKLALQCEFTVHKFMCQVIIFLFESHVILQQTFVFSLEKNKNINIYGQTSFFSIQMKTSLKSIQALSYIKDPLNNIGLNPPPSSQSGPLVASLAPSW